MEVLSSQGWMMSAPYLPCAIVCNLQLLYPHPFCRNKGTDTKGSPLHADPDLLCNMLGASSVCATLPAWLPSMTDGKVCLYLSA